MSRLDSDLATLIRTGLVLLMLGPFVVLTRKWSNPLALPPRPLAFLGVSALATCASWLCYFRALQAGPAAQVASLDKFSVVLVAVLAYAFLDERPGPMAWTGIALVPSGATLIALAGVRGT